MPRMPTTIATPEGEGLVSLIDAAVPLGWRRGRVRYWAERLLIGHGPEDARWLAGHLAEKASEMREPCAFVLWATAQAGLPWVSQEAWDSRRPDRAAGALAAISDLVDAVTAQFRE